MKNTQSVMTNDCLEDYERLKSNINMFLVEVNELTSIDIEFLTSFNRLKDMYLKDI